MLLIMIHVSVSIFSHVAWRKWLYDNFQFRDFLSGEFSPKPFENISKNFEAIFAYIWETYKKKTLLRSKKNSYNLGTVCVAVKGIIFGQNQIFWYLLDHTIRYLIPD